MVLSKAIGALVMHDVGRRIIYSKSSSLAFVSEQFGSAVSGDLHVAQELQQSIYFRSYRLTNDNFSYTYILENSFGKAYIPRGRSLRLYELASYIPSTTVIDYIEATWLNSPFKGTRYDPLIATDWVIAKYGRQSPLHHNAIITTLIQRIFMSISQRGN